jgi:ferredoxin
MITEAYDWALAQLQINYYDWIYHDIKQGYEYLTEKGIPIAVMEPLGGGRLVQLPQKSRELLYKANPDASLASWGLRFCASLDNVVVTLSGMRSTAEIKENVSLFTPFASFDESEYKATKEAIRLFQSMGVVPCSACKYCVDACPVNVDIPFIFQKDIDYKLFGNPNSLTWGYLELLPEEFHADNCIDCKKCSTLCPQNIDIPKELMEVHEKSIKFKFFKDNSNHETEQLKNANLVLFGSGIMGRMALRYFKKIKQESIFFCDNNSSFWGKEVDDVPVISPEELKKIFETRPVNVFITNINHYDAIKRQLLNLGITPIN